MDAIYYISGTLMTIIFIGLVIALILFLLKPHLINKGKYISDPVSRPKIFVICLVTMFITLFGFSGVMAATEPTSVKEARIAADAAEPKAKQDEEKRVREAAEEQRKLEEEAKRPLTKVEIKTEIIPFESTEQDDNALSKGQTRIAVEGVNGERTISYEVTYQEGVETARKEVKNEITKAPITKVTKIGTYVAPIYVAPQNQASAYYRNCSAARAAGAAPVYAGDPGYGSHLDRDNDGIGCE